MTLTPDPVDFLIKRIERLRQSVPSETRAIVALAGVPGSGKSTLSASVLSGSIKRGIKDVQVVPMDGFHYSKATLSTFSDPETAFRRRGAPFTFDAEAFVAAVEQLASAKVTEVHDPQFDVCLPGFDHAAQDPTPGEIVVCSTTKVILLEGNYTLLDEKPWSRISQLADDRWFVQVSREEATARLVRRHLGAGIETTKAAATARVEANDIPNGEYITSHLVHPDVVIQG